MFSRNTNEGIAAVLFIGFWLMLAFGVPLVGVYITGSLITSGIKTATQQCGQEFGVEPLFSGNWFCPDKKE